MYLTRKLGVSFFLIAVIALSAAELWVVSAFGIVWSADLPVSQIADIQTPKRADAKARDYLSFARAGEAKLVLVLDRPLEVSGVFGIKKQPRRIGMFVDNIRVFRAELDQRRSLRAD